MTIELKRYQKQSIEALRAYLKSVPLRAYLATCLKSYRVSLPGAVYVIRNFTLH